jgi:hypothetical protein
MLMASTGHSSTQTPQSTHLSAMTTATPSCISIASLGHESMHAPQPVQLSLTFAGIANPFQKVVRSLFSRTGWEVYIISPPNSILFSKKKQKTDTFFIVINKTLLNS